MRLQVIVFGQGVFDTRSIETAKKVLQLLYAFLSQPSFDFFLRLIPERSASLHEMATFSRQRNAGLTVVFAGRRLDQAHALQNLHIATHCRTIQLG